MKLMRNVTPDGQCKYAAVRVDKLAALLPTERQEVQRALDTLAAYGLLENPKPGEQEEFFLVKLKDRHSPAALYAYADSIRPTDAEFASEVTRLCFRAGERSPWCKEPDTTSGVKACPNAAHMGEHACKDRSQCWEPCGELGHSDEHARVGQEPAKLVASASGVPEVPHG
jgi:hypothetical protein